MQYQTFCSKSFISNNWLLAVKWEILEMSLVSALNWGCTQLIYSWVQPVSFFYWMKCLTYLSYHHYYYFNFCPTTLYSYAFTKFSFIRLPVVKSNDETTLLSILVTESWSWLSNDLDFHAINPSGRIRTARFEWSEAGLADYLDAHVQRFVCIFYILLAAALARFVML